MHLRRTLLPPLFPHERAGADDGEIAFEDGPKLRELVKTRLAQKVPHLGDAGIVVDLILPAVLFELFWREHIFKLIRIALHAAEFGDEDILPVFPDALMAIEDGAPVAQLDGKRQNEEKPGKEQQRKARR